MMDFWSFIVQLIRCLSVLMGSMLGCGCSPSYFLHQMVTLSASLTWTSGGLSGQEEADVGQTGGFLSPIEL